MNCFESEKIKLEITNTNIRTNEKFQFLLQISNDFGMVNNLELIINQQHGKNEKNVEMNYVLTKNNTSYFEGEIVFENIGIHYFCFKLNLNGEEMWIKANGNESKIPCLTKDNLPYWSITVYEKEFEVPEWAKGKIMYHIFVDRFYKSEKYMPKTMKNRITKQWGEMPDWNIDEKPKYKNNDFFMGNLKGIEEKIDYLKELGVEIVYLSPIFQSQSNHRYDVADYENVDPYLGTNLDLINLCKKAHENGMKIIIDAVFNHTGNDSKYFNEYKNYNTIGAFEGVKSPYYSWYRKNRNGEFEYWWGFKNLPVCDGNNTSWQNYVYGIDGIIDKWFKFGIDGIRLDVADELTDEFIENIRKTVKRNKKDGFIIGEVWENAVTKEGYGKQRTYLLGKGLDSVMNYPFTNAILKFVRFGNYQYLVNTINEILLQYPEEVVFSLMNSLSTHDITRAITTLVADGVEDNGFNLIWDVPYEREIQFQKDKLSISDYEKAKNMIKIAVILQYFLPGNPCIYYGDEVGLYGYKDPFNRKCFPWDKIDKELLDYYISLGRVRNKIKFLSKAKINIIKADENIFVFERYDENNKILIAVNRSENDIELELEEEFKNSEIIFNVNSNKTKILKYGIIVLRKI